MRYALTLQHSEFPSVYMAFTSLLATDGCGVVGTVLVFNPTYLSECSNLK
jgi:hypothetical protein